MISLWEYSNNLSDFYQLGAKYLRMKYIVYVLMAFLMSSCEQFPLLEGSIVDKNTRQPIEGVLVYGKIVTLKSRSDSLGRFRVVYVGRKCELCFSKEGYEDVSLKMKTRENLKTVTIELSKDTFSLVRNPAK